MSALDRRNRLPGFQPGALTLIFRAILCRHTAEERPGSCHPRFLAIEAHRHEQIIKIRAALFAPIVIRAPACSAAEFTAGPFGRYWDLASAVTATTSKLAQPHGC